MNNETKKIVFGICTYHVVIILSFIFYVTFLISFDDPVASISSLILLSAISGGAGSTLVASRYVVIAVREGKYYTNRLPWQILTPVHGAVLSVFAFFIFGSALNPSAEGNKLTPDSAQNAIIISILVGFAAEIFVKRLIAIAEAAFGEGAKGTTIDDLETGGKMPSNETGNTKAT